MKGEIIYINMKGKDEYIAEEFNKAAGGYDRSLIVKSYQRRTQVLIIKRMQIKKGMNILDLGCGTGAGTMDIALKLKGTGKVIGLDLSGKMIEQARKKLTNIKYDNVKFKVGSAISLDYNNYFDYVFSTNAFHHFKDKGNIFLKVKKALKVQGVFIVQDICDDYFLMSILDFMGKIGEKAHVGSTTSQKLKDLFLATDFLNIKVNRIKLNWFWGIMIGEGMK